MESEIVRVVSLNTSKITEIKTRSPGSYTLRDDLMKILYKHLSNSNALKFLPNDKISDLSELEAFDLMKILYKHLSNSNALKFLPNDKILDLSKVEAFADEKKNQPD